MGSSQLSIHFLYIFFTTVCTVRDLIVASWRKETKYTASTHGNELEEGNQGEITTKDTMKVFALILFLFVLI